jgi:bis(5'-nucleosidyl)-tetraphosphatase
MHRGRIADALKMPGFGDLHKLNHVDANTSRVSCPMLEVRSCGVMVFRREPELSFLLMRHVDRYDLPKGHVEEGETDEVCAFRELFEESGLSSDDIALVPDFQFRTIYYPRSRRHGGVVVKKTVIIYFGWLERGDRPIRLTEHQAYEWVKWSPPHRFGNGTIDGVLAQIEPLLRSS